MSNSSFKTVIIWNGISQLGSSGIQFLSTIILARLLSPDDFAIIGIVTIFMTLASMMVDSEMGGALLRKENVSIIDYSTLFYYNLIVSVFIYLSFFFLAPFIALFYKQPELTSVIRILSLSIIIHAFRIVQQIIIFRNLDFRAFAIINVVCGLISLIIAIISAYNGLRYWSLIIQTISMALLMTISLSVYNRFIPILKFSYQSFKYQFNFGISLLGSDIIKTIANNISTNIVAKITTLEQTGYYTQASRIPNFCQGFIGSILNQSIFPLLAKEKDENALRFKHNKLILYIILITSLFTLAFIFFSPQIITIVLGEKWLPAAPYFVILCLSTIPLSLQMLERNFLKAVGMTKLVLKLETTKSIIVIGLLLASSMVNLYTLIWATSISQVISSFIWIYETNRKNAYLKSQRFNVIFLIIMILMSLFALLYLYCL